MIFHLEIILYYWLIALSTLGFFVSILIVSNDHTCARLKSNLKVLRVLVFVTPSLWKIIVKAKLWEFVNPLWYFIIILYYWLIALSTLGFFLSILIVSSDHTCAKLKSNLATMLQCWYNNAKLILLLVILL